MNSDVDMNNNAIINVDNIKTDNIFENTLNNGITLHNETNMTNNKIINLATPVANTDAATKLYVDNTAGSSGVQNPMVANLDGGNFNINNTQNITSQTLQNTDGGNMFSKGTFQHGGLSIGDFGVGGDTITFSSALTANDSILVAYTDGTNSFLGVATADTANLTSSASFDSFANFVQFSNTALTNFDSSDFTFIA